MTASQQYGPGFDAFHEQRRRLEAEEKAEFIEDCRSVSIVYLASGVGVALLIGEQIVEVKSSSAKHVFWLAEALGKIPSAGA